MRFPSPLVALSLAFAVGVSGHAGETDRDRATASFRFLKFTELRALCTLDTRGQYVSVEAFTGFIGKPVRLAVKAPVDLYAADGTGEPLKAGEKPVAPLCTFAALPDTPRQLVVLFGDEKKVVANVIPDNPEKFPFGRVLAVNMTGTPLLMEVGGAVNRLPATGAMLCAAPGGFVGDGNIVVRITAADRAHSRIYGTVWPYDHEVRLMAFIYKNESGRIVVRTIADANVPELAEAKAGPADLRAPKSGKK